MAKDYLSQLMGMDLLSSTKPLEKAWKKGMKKLRAISDDHGSQIADKHETTWESVGESIATVGFIGQKVGEVFGRIGGFALNTIGIFMQFANAIGILDPIIKLITSVFTIMGGAAMEILTPAIQKLAEVLFSPEMMKIWGEIGTVIGNFLATILNAISTLLADPDFQKVMYAFILAIEGLFAAITTVFGWFFDLIGSMNAGEIGRLFYVLGIGLAFMVGLMSGGLLGVILGAAFAVAAAIALAPLLNIESGAGGGGGTTYASKERGIMGFQHGGYIGPTRGGTHIIVAEGGEGEFIVPESKMGGDNLAQKETLWATEENGKKLDKLIAIMMMRDRRTWR